MTLLERMGVGAAIASAGSVSSGDSAADAPTAGVSVRTGTSPIGVLADSGCGVTDGAGDTVGALTPAAAAAAKTLRFPDGRAGRGGGASFAPPGTAEAEAVAADPALPTLVPAGCAVDTTMVGCTSGGGSRGIVTCATKPLPAIRA